MTILFDCVLFDLDGTLVATDRFWVQAARTGARRAFRELGLERDLPDAARWMDLVGKPLTLGFRELFPDLDDRQRLAVQEACVREEHRLLEAGGAALMPGAHDLLASLRAAGIGLGIASNCSRSYLDHMLVGLGLGELVDHAFCLDSPGIRDKADMLARLLEHFGTRSAVMVGDRAGDRDAAWANGLPHVHCAFGFAGHGEEVAAEAVIWDLPELGLRLADRRDWITRALEALGAFRPPLSPRPGESASRPAVLGISGAPLAGKALFARDAARILAERGRCAAVVSLESFRRPRATLAAGALERPLEALYDLERLAAELLDPHAAGQPVSLPPGEGSPGVQVPGVEVPSGALLLLEGPFLLDPRIAPRLARTLWLGLDEDRVLLRAAGRERRSAAASEALGSLRSELLPAWQAFEARYPPGALADLVLDGANPLGSPSGVPGA